MNKILNEENMTKFAEAKEEMAEAAGKAAKAAKKRAEVRGKECRFQGSREKISERNCLSAVRR